jgi:hypothetical protein
MPLPSGLNHKFSFSLDLFKEKNPKNPKIKEVKKKEKILAQTHQNRKPITYNGLTL